MLTNYGLDTAITIIAICVGVIIAACFIPSTVLRILIIFFTIAVVAFTLYFFRDPDRTVPQTEDGVLSPADGRIVSVGMVEAPEYLESQAMQICIFMSPLDVHINRFPVSGTVEYVQHYPGKFMAAWEDKSSNLNERTLIGINTGQYRMLFKQIAGFLARRIVCPLSPGAVAQAGERFGMIKFGSRLDVLLPVDAEVLVQMNQAVRAGETIIARVKR